MATTAHPATQFTSSVKQRKSPEETLEQELAHVDDVRTGYARSASSSVSQYQVLTDTVPEPPEEIVTESSAPEPAA